MKISIFGIGYVGVVSAGCLARDGHHVLAVDPSKPKLAAIAAGRSPIVEPGIDELIADNVAKGRLQTARNATQAIAQSDISFVCVGTPANTNGSLDTRYVEDVAEEIGTAMRGKNTYHSVVMRSTMVPGTMDGLVIPRLERASGKQVGEGFGIAYYPEFLREGSAIEDYDNPGAIVLGVRDEKTAQLLADLHVDFTVQPRLMSIRTAEAVKYVNNSWHAMKISFANEVGRIAKAFDIDSHEVMETLCADRKLNISPAYLKPGFSFGGSCLPKDVRALRYAARAADLETPVLDGILAANEQQLEAGYRMVVDTGKRRVGLVGLSFKPQTDDLRYSPFVILAERLIGHGFQVRIYDPIVRLSRLTGANRRYLMTHLPHIAELLLESEDELLAHSEVIVVGNPKAGAAILKNARDAVTVIDLVRVEKDRRSRGKYHGICW